LQLKMRFRLSHPPLKIPNLRKAVKLYWEQVGVYLQVAGVKGEIKLR